MFINIPTNALIRCRKNTEICRSNISINFILFKNAFVGILINISQPLLFDKATDRLAREDS